MSDTIKPVAWVEHHKAGDNLLWDDPGGKRTALYTAAALDAAREEGRQEMQAECERLRDELAAAQKDAERYRWLSSDKCDYPTAESIVRLRKDWFDAEIDAAMAKERRDE